MTDAKRLPGPRAETWDWQLEAACRDIDDTVFFHPDHERGNSRTAREDRAKAICAECPVSAECLAHALAVREPYGVWGGLGEQECRTLHGAGARSASGS